MAEKKDSDDDGPTINGRPILSVEDVQTWFGVEKCIICPECAAAIARDLNHCAFLSSSWKNTLELRAARRMSPFQLSMERIYTALRSLQDELPRLIPSTCKVFPIDAPSSTAPVEKLLAAAIEVAPGFQKFAPRGRGRSPDPWHNIARNVGRNIAKVFVENCGKRAGLGKPTSPAIRIVKSALAYLKEDHSEEAIVDAIRSRRTRSRFVKKGGNKPGIPQTPRNAQRVGRETGDGWCF